MSKRTPQPAVTDTPSSKRKKSLLAGRLFFNIENLLRTQALHKTPGFGVVIFRICRLDQQKEFFTRRKCEPRHVKYRMVRCRQAVEKQHPKDSDERREQDRQFVCRRYE